MRRKQKKSVNWTANLQTPVQMISCEICEIFQNTYLEEHLRTTSSKHGSSFLEVFCRSCCSALFRRSGSKLENVQWKFTKKCTPSQIFFKEFHRSCRTAILKNVSSWLLLKTNLFWKHSCMAASQSSCRRIFFLEILTHILHILL